LQGCARTDIIDDVKLHEREDFLRRVSSGEVALSVALDVEADDLAALTRVGAAALAAGRHELAERVFAGLVALAPHERVHALHLAAARHARGDVAGALAAVNDALAPTTHPAAPADLQRDDEVDALLLRAELRGRADPDAALADLARARALQTAAALARSAR
jgi:hypothetical protein